MDKIGRKFEASRDEYFTGINGRSIIVTHHYGDRYGDIDRFSRLANDPDFREDVLWVVRNAMREIMTQHVDRTGKYGVHSKSTGIGVIIDWRPDGRVHTDNRNHAMVVTLLPIKRFHHFKANDISIIVESLLMDYLRESLDRERQPLRETEGAVDSVQDRSGSTLVVAWEGKYHSDTIDEFLFVR